MCKTVVCSEFFVNKLFKKYITILISPIPLNYLNSVSFISILTSIAENLVFWYGLFIIL